MRPYRRLLSLSRFSYCIGTSLSLPKTITELELKWVITAPVACNPRLETVFTRKDDRDL